MNSNYLPVKFLELGAMIARLTMDEEVLASFPRIGEYNEMTFFVSVLGKSDRNEGNFAAFFYDDHNDLFGYFTGKDLLERGGDKYPNFTPFELFDEIGGNTFPNLLLLETHLKYGVS